MGVAVAGDVDVWVLNSEMIWPLLPCDLCLLDGE